MSNTYDKILGDFMYRWLSIPGVAEIRTRRTSVNNETASKLTVVLRVDGLFNIDDVLKEATDMLSDEHWKEFFVTATYEPVHFEEIYGYHSD